MLDSLLLLRIPILSSLILVILRLALRPQLLLLRIPILPPVQVIITIFIRQGKLLIFSALIPHVILQALVLVVLYIEGRLGSRTLVGGLLVGSGPSAGHNYSPAPLVVVGVVVGCVGGHSGVDDSGLVGLRAPVVEKLFSHGLLLLLLQLLPQLQLLLPPLLLLFLPLLLLVLPLLPLLLLLNLLGVLLPFVDGTGGSVGIPVVVAGYRPARETAAAGDQVPELLWGC